MKSNFVFSSSSLFIGLFLFFFTENVCSQESADNWTLKQARQWTQKQEWANGLKAMPHKTTDYQEFASQYQSVGQDFPMASYPRPRKYACRTIRSRW